MLSGLFKVCQFHSLLYRPISILRTMATHPCFIWVNLAELIPLPITYIMNYDVIFS